MREIYNSSAQGKMTLEISRGTIPRGMCEHLIELERELLAAGIALTFRGQAWSDNCREWAYFACYLDLASIRKRMKLADCVEDHANLDSHSGEERGLVCVEHKDGIIGRLHAGDGYPTIG